MMECLENVFDKIIFEEYVYLKQFVFFVKKEIYGIYLSIYLYMYI